MEDTSHYLLHCHHFLDHHAVLMNSVKSISNNFESMPETMSKKIYFDMVTRDLMKTTIKLFSKPL